MPFRLRERRSHTTADTDAQPARRPYRAKEEYEATQRCFTRDLSRRGPLAWRIFRTADLLLFAAEFQFLELDFSMGSITPQLGNACWTLKRYPIPGDHQVADLGEA